jgi:hypothetical protein
MMCLHVFLESATYLPVMLSTLHDVSMFEFWASRQTCRHRRHQKFVLVVTFVFCSSSQFTPKLCRDSGVMHRKRYSREHPAASKITLAKIGKLSSISSTWKNSNQNQIKIFFSFMVVILRRTGQKSKVQILTYGRKESETAGFLSRI